MCLKSNDLEPKSVRVFGCRGVCLWFGGEGLYGAVFGKLSIGRYKVLFEGVEVGEGVLIRYLIGKRRFGVVGSLFS